MKIPTPKHAIQTFAAAPGMLYIWIDPKYEGILRKEAAKFGTLDSPLGADTSYCLMFSRVYDSDEIVAYLESVMNEHHRA